MHQWETQRWQNMIVHFGLDNGLVTSIGTEGHIIFPETSLLDKPLLVVVDQLGRRDLNLGCWKMTSIISWTEEKASFWFTREIEMIEVKIEEDLITEITGQISKAEHRELSQAVEGHPLSNWVLNEFTMRGRWSPGAELSVAVSNFGKKIVDDTVCFTRVKMN